MSAATATQMKARVTLAPDSPKTPNRKLLSQHDFWHCTRTDSFATNVYKADNKASTENTQRPGGMMRSISRSNVKLRGAAFLRRPA